MSGNAPPPGSDPGPEESGAPSKGRIPKEDRIAFVLILLVICVVGLGLVWSAGWAMSLLGVAVGATESGVGLRDAFVVSVPVSFVAIMLFALVAGDGALGELGLMLIGFFVMLVFFTGAIAIIL